MACLSPPTHINLGGHRALNARSQHEEQSSDVRRGKSADMFCSSLRQRKSLDRVMVQKISAGLGLKGEY